jgi:ribonuclease P protein component
MPTLGRLKTRPEFLRVAATRRKAVRPGLILQARRRKPEEAGADGPEHPIRFGLTASRKVGGAVVRNRARRRLRAAAQAVLPECGEAGTDYVLIARATTVERSFPDLTGDLKAALAEVHKPRSTSGRGRGGPRQRAKDNDRPAARRKATRTRPQEREEQA